MDMVFGCLLLVGPALDQLLELRPSEIAGKAARQSKKATMGQTTCSAAVRRASPLALPLAFGPPAARSRRGTPGRIPGIACTSLRCGFQFSACTSCTRRCQRPGHTTRVRPAPGAGRLPRIDGNARGPGRRGDHRKRDRAAARQWGVNRSCPGSAARIAAAAGGAAHCGVATAGSATARDSDWSRGGGGRRTCTLARSRRSGRTLSFRPR